MLLNKYNEIIIKVVVSEKNKFHYLPRTLAKYTTKKDKISLNIPIYCELWVSLYFSTILGCFKNIAVAPRGLLFSGFSPPPPLYSQTPNFVFLQGQKMPHSNKTIKSYVNNKFLGPRPTYSD